VFIANLQPATLMGLRSEGMALAVQSGKKLSLIRPESPAPNGAQVS
jgi:tRNA-binding EMAP/Myf-like protein